ncbi:hypothetical protein R3P38DRAFT_3295004 [Favolaschia claudopus]|uniref:Uncharacterized protein n=1 Tax=Favolaschia claudopus TaxID=2862362 RepID=A0AAV9ZC96_9AGAR
MDDIEDEDVRIAVRALGSDEEWAAVITVPIHPQPAQVPFTPALSVSLASTHSTSSPPQTPPLALDNDREANRQRDRKDLGAPPVAEAGPPTYASLARMQSFPLVSSAVRVCDTEVLNVAIYLFASSPWNELPACGSGDGDNNRERERGDSEGAGVVATSPFAPAPAPDRPRCCRLYGMEEEVPTAPFQHQRRETPSGADGRLFLLEAGGLSAALSDESVRRLRYCLNWLQYATQHIDAQILILRDFIASLHPYPPNPSASSSTPAAPPELTPDHLRTLTHL